jgi:hypothetical protein
MYDSPVLYVVKAKGLELELAQTKEHIQTLEVRQAQWSARSARLLAKYDVSTLRKRFYGGTGTHYGCL